MDGAWYKAVRVPAGLANWPASADMVVEVRRKSMTEIPGKFWVVVAGWRPGFFEREKQARQSYERFRGAVHFCANAGLCEAYNKFQALSSVAAQNRFREMVVVHGRVWSLASKSLAGGNPFDEVPANRIPHLIPCVPQLAALIGSSSDGSVATKPETQLTVAPLGGDGSVVDARRQGTPTAEVEAAGPVVIELDGTNEEEARKDQGSDLGINWKKVLKPVAPIASVEDCEMSTKNLRNLNANECEGRVAWLKTAVAAVKVAQANADRVVVKKAAALEQFEGEVMDVDQHQLRKTKRALTKWEGRASAFATAVARIRKAAKRTMERWKAVEETPPLPATASKAMLTSMARGTFDWGALDEDLDVHRPSKKRKLQQDNENLASSNSESESGASRALNRGSKT